MKCKRLKPFLLSLALLLFLSSVSYSEVCLTDEEFNQVVQDLEDLETLSIQQAELVMELQTRLATASRLQTALERIIQQAKDSYKEAEIYWRRQRLEAAILFSLIGAGSAIVFVSLVSL